MMKFAMPKLVGNPISIKTFDYFATVLPVDGDSYRLFVGLLELGVGLLLIVNIFIADRAKNAYAIYVSYFLLTGVCIGALFHEYFVRPEPVAFLVQLSVIFLFVAAFQFFVSFKYLEKDKALALFGIDK
ncbi:hypothetical protein VIAG107301_15315 [Vibrio agarivorans]